MTLTALMRKRNPPGAGGFERYTLESALWQLKASCTHHGRKMLRVCLMLLRDEAKALNDLRTLDDWQAKNPQCHAFATYTNETGAYWICRSHSVDRIFTGATPDDVRHEAAQFLREQTKSPRQRHSTTHPALTAAGFARQFR